MLLRVVIVLETTDIDRITQTDFLTSEQRYPVGQPGESYDDSSR